MIRITCTCSCGKKSWSEDVDDGKQGFTHHEGVADDCNDCHGQTNAKVDKSFTYEMRNVTPIRKRGRGR